MGNRANKRQAVSALRGAMQRVHASTVWRVLLPWCCRVAVCDGVTVLPCAVVCCRVVACDRVAVLSRGSV